MDELRFDAWTRALVARLPRRRVWGGAAGGALAGLGFQFGREQAAQETAAKRCLKEDKSCKQDSECCSGVCRRHTCRQAPGQETCRGEDFCRGIEVECNLETNVGCRCFVTTRGTSFCGDLFNVQCSRCATNADCTEVTGAGSVCVRAKSSDCFCDDDTEPGLRACVAPCGG